MCPVSNKFLTKYQVHLKTHESIKNTYDSYRLKTFFFYIKFFSFLLIFVSFIQGKVSFLQHLINWQKKGLFSQNAIRRKYQVQALDTPMRVLASGVDPAIFKRGVSNLGWRFQYIDRKKKREPLEHPTPPFGSDTEPDCSNLIQTQIKWLIQNDWFQLILGGGSFYFTVKHYKYEISIYILYHQSPDLWLFQLLQSPPHNLDSDNI